MTDTATQEAPEQEVPEAKELDTPRYVVLDYAEGTQNRFALAWREVKVSVPACAVCQKLGKPGWWLRCKHNPYISNVREDVETPIIECAVCHERVAEGTMAHCGVQDFIQTGTEVKPSFRPQPNLRGVRVDESANSGRSLEAATGRGARLLNDAGIASMCEFSRCWKPVQTASGARAPGSVWTTWGAYCSQEEAKLVALVNGREAVEIFDKNRQAAQLREISL